ATPMRFSPGSIPMSAPPLLPFGAESAAAKAGRSRTMSASCSLCACAPSRERVRCGCGWEMTMRFGLLLASVALAALFACSKPAAPPTSVSTATPRADPAAAAASFTPLTVAGLNVSCNAAHESVCDDKGCRAQTDGMIHVALSYEGATAAGDFCIGETCSA